jgi:large subunit ribosomal protein L3
MTIGLVGRKCGMTRIFTDDGAAIPVSVVEVFANTVVQVKTVDIDGYNAIQVTTGITKRSKLSKPLAGHYAKSNVDAGRGLWEFRLNESDINNYTVGNELNVGIFEEGGFVDVKGTSIGKGFQGVVKRYNFRTQDATHGNSRSHRAPGSIGQNQTPGRVVKGKKMCGHMGSENVTIQSLRLFGIDKEKSLLFIKGAIPGPSGGDVIVKPAVKKK